ncbi:MAG: hypothetical protein QXU79_00255 [Candidatus Micrarchaeaceae archaeon]
MPAKQRRRFVEIYIPEREKWIDEKLRELAVERFKGSYNRALWAVVRVGLKVWKRKAR